MPGPIPKAIVAIRRERKRLRSPNPEVRSRLLDAANSVIREQGFPDLRVEEICSRAGVSVGTFYLYFEGKEDLFTSLVVEHTQQLRACCQKAYAPPGSVMERLRRGTQAYLDFVEENARGFLYFLNAASLETTAGSLRSWAFDEHTADLRPLLEEGMRRGEIKTQDPVLLAQAVLGMMQHLAGFWVEHKHEYDRAQILAALAVLSVGFVPRLARATGARSRRRAV